MYGFDDAVAAILFYLRLAPAEVYEQALLSHLKQTGHGETMVTLALSSLTAGGTLVIADGRITLGAVDLSLPLDLPT